MTVERIEWQQFIGRAFDWRQGEHIGIIGPTGRGKTTLMVPLLERHRYIVAFGTKPRDSTMVRLIRQGDYDRIEEWDPKEPARLSPKRVLWPDARSMYAASTQQAVFLHALDCIFRQGYWTVAIDELWYVIHALKLDHEIKTYLLQGRSLGISLLMASQRPAFIPLEVYDQSTHLFFFRDQDRRNLDRLSGINAVDSTLVRKTILSLGLHESLYVNTRTDTMLITQAPPLEGEGNGRARSRRH